MLVVEFPVGGRGSPSCYAGSTVTPRAGECLHNLHGALLPASWPLLPLRDGLRSAKVQFRASKELRGFRSSWVNED
jgi:hypothetical protein